MPERYITGSSGFIGRNLLERYPDCNRIPHEDIPIVRFRRFSDFFYLSSYGNMAHQTDGRQTIQANLTDPVDMVVRTLNIDYKSFVWFSSSSVALEQQTLYSRAKAAGEQALLGISETYNKPICIIRPFSVTGVGEQSKHLIPTIIRSCLDGEPMSLVLPPVHDFIDVRDVVDGVVSLSAGGARGVFELGTGIKHTNEEVLRIVEDITGKRANVTVVKSMRTYDNNDWVSKNFRAREYGWEPRFTLRDSIEEMVNAHRTTA